MPKPEARVHRHRGALSSKKFWAFILSTTGWNILIGIGVMKYMPPDQWSTLVLLAMIVAQGVVEVGYIIGQAGLDALTALFDIITPDSVFGAKKPKGDAPLPADEDTDS